MAHGCEGICPIIFPSLEQLLCAPLAPEPPVELAVAFAVAALKFIPLCSLLLSSVPSRVCSQGRLPVTPLHVTPHLRVCAAKQMEASHVTQPAWGGKELRVEKEGLLNKVAS